MLLVKSTEPKDFAGALALRDAAIYLKSLPPGWPSQRPSQPVVIKLGNGQIMPEHSCVTVGQEFRVVSGDGEGHSLAIRSPRRGRLDTPPGGGAGDGSYTFTQAEEGLSLHCTRHPQERGYLTVVPHPVWALTGEDGTFQLPDRLPAGRYVLRVFHPYWGGLDHEVALKPDATTASLKLYLPLNRDR